MTAFLSRLGTSVPLYLASISAAPISGWLIDHQHLTAWGWFAAACCGMALLFRHWGSASHSSAPAAV